MTTAITISSNISPFEAINRANLAKTTRHQYKRQIELYMQSGNSLGDAEQLAQYAQSLKSSPKAFLKSAVKLWTNAVENQVKSGANPDNIAAVQATIFRLDSLNHAITVEQPKGKRAHNWLTGSQRKHLYEVIDNDRDRLIIGLMLQTGLRRNEVITLKYSDVAMLGTTHVLNVTGKGSKDRTIPITAKLAESLKTYHSDNETIFNLTGQSILNICQKYGAMIGVDLKPHDMRRTFAQVALDNGVDITQISQLLGHSSVETTMKYLDLDVQKLPVIGDFMTF